MFDIKKATEEAETRIRPHIRETPLDYSIQLSQQLGCHVYFKCENLQYTGAFKVRGAMNKLLMLTHTEGTHGVVTASTGNHGAAVAYGLKKLKLPGIVFVPENASSTKVDNIRQYNVPLEFFGDDSMQTELHALDYAKQHLMKYISPYNDEEVIAGQGTIALEIFSKLKKIDAIFVPVGGGGLISGIAGYIKGVSPSTQVIGCLPINSPVMAESVKAGHIVEMKTKPTISDATAGGLEPHSITFDICKTLVDDFVLVSEDEIKNAIISIMKSQHLLVEGASGVALASAIKQKHTLQGKTIIVILSGANISIETLKTVIT